MGKVYVFNHPLIQHKVSLMRDKETSVKEFRELAKEVALLMGFEATRNLPALSVAFGLPSMPLPYISSFCPSYSI